MAAGNARKFRAPSNPPRPAGALAAASGRDGVCHRQGRTLRGLRLGPGLESKPLKTVGDGSAPTNTLLKQGVNEKKLWLSWDYFFSVVTARPSCLEAARFT